MVQITLSPEDLEPKMTEEKRVKESPGGGTAPKPELQTVRFDWAGLPVGPGSEVVYYKPNQSRSGDSPQGGQPVPSIWMPTQHGTPWQYSGLTENSLANGHPAPTPPLEWYGTKHLLGCGGILLLLLLLLRSFEQMRQLLQIRPRRDSQVQNTLKVVCQLRDEQSKPKSPSKVDESSDMPDKPPSYSTNSETAADAAKDENASDRVLPFSCIFTSGKGKVPRVMFYDVHNEQKVMDRLGVNKTNGPFISQHMKFNVPTQVDVNNPRYEKTNVFIEINDPDSESGCVIGMDVLVNKEIDDALIIEKREGVPFSITVEKLNVCENPLAMKIYGEEKI